MAENQTQPVQTANSTSTVLAAVLLGGVIGSASTFAIVSACGYTLEKKESNAPPASAAAPPGAAGMPPGGGPAGGPPQMGMMGGGMMGMMGGGGFGGGPNGKRSLTTLVGKLELLTRGNVRIELDADQAAKISAKLAELDATEKMTADEAQKQFEELEAMLTPEQKETIEAVGLPGGGRGGRGGRGGPGGGPGAPGGGMGMMMGRGGPPADNDENPFRQEANDKRLQDLLARVKPQ